MSRLWSRVCSSFAAVGHARSAVPASSSRRPAGVSSRRSVPVGHSPGRGLVDGVSPQVYLVMERDGVWLQPIWLSRGRHSEPWSRSAQGTLRSVPAWKGRSRCRNHCLAKQAPLGLSRRAPMATALRTSPLPPALGPGRRPISGPGCRPAHRQRKGAQAPTPGVARRAWASWRGRGAGRARGRPRGWRGPRGPCRGPGGERSGSAGDGLGDRPGRRSGRGQAEDR